MKEVSWLLFCAIMDYHKRRDDFMAVYTREISKVRQESMLKLKELERKHHKEIDILNKQKEDIERILKEELSEHATLRDICLKTGRVLINRQQDKEG